LRDEVTALEMIAGRTQRQAASMDATAEGDNGMVRFATDEEASIK